MPCRSSSFPLPLAGLEERRKSRGSRAATGSTCKADKAAFHYAQAALFKGVCAKRVHPLTSYKLQTCEVNHV